MLDNDPRVHPSRRTVLATVAIGAACSGIYWPKPAAAKMIQTAALYQDSPKGDQRCENCNLFVAPSECKIVAGNISPAGWCRFYIAKH